MYSPNPDIQWHPHSYPVSTDGSLARFLRLQRNDASHTSITQPADMSNVPIHVVSALT